MAHTARSNDLAEWAATNLQKARSDSEGPWLTACCPLHEDSTPSLRLNTETGGYECKAGCGTGNVWELARQAGLPAPPDRPKNDDREPEAVYTYQTAEGEPYARVTRWPGKKFRQSRWEAGEWVPKAPLKRLPYNLAALAKADPSAPVVWAEGEKDVEAATQRGLLATTSPGGAGAFDKLDRSALEVLRGRTLVVIPDNDEPGRAYARAVGAALIGVGVTVRYLTLPDLPPKGDLSDWFAAGGTAEELLRLAELAGENPPPAGDPESTQSGAEEPEEGGSQAKRLLAQAADLELYHTPDQEPYASALVEGPNGLRRENHRVGSNGMRRLLTHRFHASEGKPPSEQALRGALSVLEARAVYDGPELSVHVRVAEHDGAVYLDLAGERGEAVRVTAAGWEVASDPPVRFVRPRGLEPLPHPEKGGSLEELRAYLNLSTDEDFALAVGWLLDALQPSTPFPILCLEGEQGSGKTSMARKLRALVDPNRSPVRGLPREARDLAVSAANGWVLAYDNLSGISEWVSDNLCSVSTGGGFAARKNYTDDEEALFHFRRPVILTGIAGLTGKPDLGDRTVILTLPVIPEQARRSERELEQGFEAARPRILGALLTAVSTGLRLRDSVSLERKPRMADFAEWVTACEPACPWLPGTFLRAYAGNRAEMVETTLQGNPVAMAVRKLLERTTEWSGSPTELLTALEGLLEERERRAAGWPRRASALAKRLREAATFLRAAGVEVDWSRSNRSRTIRLSRTEIGNEEDLSLLSPLSQTAPLSLLDSDGSEPRPVTPPLVPSLDGDRSAPAVTGVTSVPSPKKRLNKANRDRVTGVTEPSLLDGIDVQALLEGLP